MGEWGTHLLTWPSGSGYLPRQRQGHQLTNNMTSQKDLMQTRDSRIFLQLLINVFFPAIKINMKKLGRMKSRKLSLEIIKMEESYIIKR